jgi:hypothetical protein
MGGAGLQACGSITTSYFCFWFLFFVVIPSAARDPLFGLLAIQTYAH